MGTGICICGLNGCGKSTLGKILAKKLGFHFIDNENLYFPKREKDAPYPAPNSREKVEQLLMEEVSTHENFVFAAVKGDYGRDILPFYSCVVLMKVPKTVRSQRIRARSFQKFGKRMLPGGDLYEEEEAFFHIAEARQDDYAENWLQQLECPVIRVDGTRPLRENAEFIIQQLKL